MEQNRVLIVLLTVFAVLGIVITLGALGLNPFGSERSRGDRISEVNNESLVNDEQNPLSVDNLRNTQNDVDDTMERLQEGNEERIPLGENENQESQEGTQQDSEDIQLAADDTDQYIPQNAQPSRSQSTSPQTQRSTSSQTSTASRSNSSANASSTPQRTQRVTVQEYWIQVGAYSDRFQAQFVAERLEQEGLKGTLFTTSSGAQTLFRVRIGPYTSRTEAEKFLAWITPLDGFEDSYVSRMTNTRHQ
jgi:cell division protein FtsN